jgi:hypothetical protein
MADAAVGVAVGADANEGAEGATGVERGFEEGGDTVEEHGEVGLGAEFKSGVRVDANTEDESAAELVVAVEVDS